MTDLKPGDRIAINADIAPGAFPGEFLVTINTATGPLSGFVREDPIVRAADRPALIATVRNVSATTIAVWLTGSFFTSTGLADLTTDWRERDRACPGLDPGVRARLDARAAAML
jgi:hypothetical protein